MFELASAAIILLFGGYFAQTIGAAADDFLAHAKIARAAGKSKLLKAAIKKKIAGKALKFWILIVFAMMSAKIMGLDFWEKSHWPEFAFLPRFSFILRQLSQQIFGGQNLSVPKPSSANSPAELEKWPAVSKRRLPEFEFILPLW